MVEPEHSQQPSNDNEHEDCPAFLAGSLLSFERGFDWIKRDDNDKAVVAGFTIVLAVSTIGLWIATNKLWEAGERQLKHLGDTASAQLRAYISVDSGGYYRQSQRRRTIFEFIPEIKNDGQTPANKVRIISRIEIKPPQIPENFDYEIPETFIPLSSITTIGAGQKKVHSRILPQLATQAELRDIYKGTKCFHVWGAVKYEDIFGIPRHTNFSYLIFVGNKRQRVVWHNTDSHNDAT